MMTNIDVGYWTAMVAAIALKIIGAILVWIVGRWLISLATRLLKAPPSFALLKAQ
jgi:hypothetical protein